MVYVEKKVVDDAALIEDELFSSIRNQLCTFREGTDTSGCSTLSTKSRALGYV